METTSLPAVHSGPAFKLDREIRNPFAGGRTNRYRFSVHRADGTVAANERQVLAGLLPTATPEDRRRALQHLSSVSARFTDDIIRLSSAGNFPAMNTGTGIPVAASFSDSQRRTVDTRWAPLFDVIDNRGANNPYFRIVDTYNAVEFRVYMAGERIEMRHVEGNQEVFTVDIVAGGLQWNQLWAKWQSFIDVARMVADMYTKYANTMAQAAYAVITASGALTQSYDATGATALAKDINTINAAATKIRTEIFGADAGSTGETTEEDIGDATLYLLYNANTAGYAQRIMQALQATLLAPNANLSVGFVEHPVVPLGSAYVPTGAWYLVLPGRKLVLDIHEDLQLYEVNDPRLAGVADGRVGQGAYKFVRGDANQVVALSLS